MPKTAKAFKTLRDVRNRRAVHFDPSTDTKDREYALDAIRSLNQIVEEQFGTSPPAPCLVPGVNGGVGFVKKEMEGDPFVKLVYLPNAFPVGPEHYLESASDGSWEVFDRDDYEDSEISDEDFVVLYEEAVEARLAEMRESEEDPVEEHREP